MTIAFDGRKAACDTAESGRAARMAIMAVARRCPECRIHIYVSRKKDYPLLGELLALDNVVLCYPEHSVLRFCPFLWRRHGIAAELRHRMPDIYHGLDGELPEGVSGIPGLACAVTVSDLVFLSSPYGFSWFQRHRNNILVRRACLSSSRIFAPSQAVAADIVKYYFIPKEKITVLPVLSGTGGTGIEPLGDRLAAVYEEIRQVR